MTKSTKEDYSQKEGRALLDFLAARFPGERNISKAAVEAFEFRKKALEEPVSVLLSMMDAGTLQLAPGLEIATQTGGVARIQYQGNRWE